MYSMQPTVQKNEEGNTITYIDHNFDPGNRFAQALYNQSTGTYTGILIDPTEGSQVFSDFDPQAKFLYDTLQAKYEIEKQFEYESEILQKGSMAQ